MLATSDVCRQQPVVNISSDSIVCSLQTSAAYLLFYTSIDFVPPKILLWHLTQHSTVLDWTWLCLAPLSGYRTGLCTTQDSAVIPDSKAFNSACLDLALSGTIEWIPYWTLYHPRFCCDTWLNIQQCLDCAWLHVAPLSGPYWTLHHPRFCCDTWLNIQQCLTGLGSVRHHSVDTVLDFVPPRRFCCDTWLNIQQYLDELDSIWLHSVAHTGLCTTQDCCMPMWAAVRLTFTFLFSSFHI